ncbi:MAG: hypothetical protein AAFQ62_15775 [Pseudomonadota bacterium]
MKSFSDWLALHADDAMGWAIIALIVAGLFGGLSLTARKMYKTHEHVRYVNGTLMRVLPSSAENGYSSQYPLWPVEVQLATGETIKHSMYGLPEVGAVFCFDEYRDGFRRLHYRATFAAKCD